MIALMIRPSVTPVETDFYVECKADKIKSINAQLVFRFSDLKETYKTDL